jgi:isochorismate synthase
MDAGFLARALDELAASAAPLRAITLPAPVAPLETIGGAPLLRWCSPAPEADGRAWSLAGSGEVARLEAAGEARFEEIRRGADDLFASIVEVRHPSLAGVALPSLRLHGGLAFRPEPSRPHPWTAFRDASFALPRVLYGASGDLAFVRFCFRADEHLDAADLSTLLRGLGTPAATTRGRRTEAHLDRLGLDAWRAMLGDALGRIRARELTKVVPAALTKVIAAGPLDPAAALASLGALYPECVRFAFQRGDAVFLGASPERLVDKRGAAVETDALAGSAPRRDDDARAAAALLESDKDRREHHAVVEAIEAALAPLCRDLRVPSAPVVRTLRNVHHLATPIRGTLARPAHVLDLVRLLHPTPAVCGTPREAAMRWIAAHEPAPRGWYAGAVGWFDAAGDGAFSVAIRAGVLAQREAWLYAGAGVVEGSDPGQEYAETRTKLAPMLAALGLSARGEGAALVHGGLQ